MIKTNRGECIKTYIGNKFCGMYIDGDNIVHSLTSSAIKILIKNFPDKVNEILNYIHNHSKLVPFINEDPMMVCSLGIEGMPIRWLCNARDGDYAYCLTDEIINTATDTLKYRVRAYSRSTNWQIMTPYYKENVLTLQKFGDPYGISVSYGAGNWANVKQGVNTEQGIIVEFKAGTGPYINGSFIPNRYGSFITPGTYVLGGNNNNNTTKGGTPIDLGDVFEHYRNGVLIHQFAPIVCATKNGMIDIVNMEFHPNQGTGHFTDAYTLQDGVTPWYPI